MSLVRFRVECRGRVEYHEVGSADVEIGRDPACTLALDDPSVAPRHARVIVRRGCVILMDLGRTRSGISRRGERVLAPVMLRPGEPFRLGELELAAWVRSRTERGFAGRTLASGQVDVEIESPDPGLRRYRMALSDGGAAELVATEPEVAPLAAAAWLDRVRRSSGIRVGVPAVVAQVSVEGRALVVEAVPRGLRLSSLFAAIAERRVELPIEAAIATFALAARTLSSMHAAWGAHGALDPRRVQLGLDGSVSLLRPGPEQPPHRTTLDEYLAPELRVDPAASTAGDAYALGAVGKRLFLRRDDCPTRIRAICCWLAHVDARQRPQDLQALASELERAAHSAGLDPTFGHIARVARLLAPNTGRPLCLVSPGLAAREPSNPSRSGGCPV